MSDLSLFGIESGLHDLFSAWQEAETPEQVESAEVAIRACAEAEVRKVDNIRRYWRALDALVAAAKHEAATQAERARMLDARRERLKSVVYEVMDQFGLKKLEGQTGTLYLKGNGGKQAVDITDASMVPDELCMMEGRMPLFIWIGIRQSLELAARFGVNVAADTLLDMDGCVAMKRVVSASLVGAALEGRCGCCKGSGTETVVSDNGREEYESTRTCLVCGGSGKQGVPGARLLERGAHVECW